MQYAPTYARTRSTDIYFLVNMLNSISNKLNIIKTARHLMIALALSSLACSSVSSSEPHAKPSKTPSAENNAAENNAEKQHSLAQRFKALQNGKRTVIRLTQFGDSHSAADFFTGAVRQRLQDAYGDAGIGWIAPMGVRGQRHARVAYEHNGWTLSSSRNEARNDYPMGGYIANADEAEATINLTPRKEEDFSALWRVSVLFKNPARQTCEQKPVRIGN